MYPEDDKPSAASGEDTGSADQTYDVLQDEMLDALVRRGNGA